MTQTKKTSRPPQEIQAQPMARMVLPLGFLIGILFLSFISRMSLAPLMPAIEQDLNIGHAQAGSFFLVMSIGFAMGMASSGWLAAKLTHHWTIAISGVANGIMVLILSLSMSGWQMQLSLFGCGVAAGFYLPSGVAVITSAIRPADWGKALAFQQLAPNLAYVAGPLLAGVILHHFNWRLGLGCFGLTSLVYGLAFARWGRGARFFGQKPSFKAMSEFLTDRTFWLLVALFSLAIGVNQGTYAMIPLYLTSGLGLDLERANHIIAISRILSLTIPLITGWLADNLGLKKAIAGVAIISGSATLWLALATPETILAPMIFQAMAGVCFFPLGFAAMAVVTSGSNRNLAVGISVPIAHTLGAGLVPAGIGILGEAGRFDLGIGLLGGLTLAGLGLIALMKLDR